MLHLVQGIEDPLSGFIKDDPVRPHIEIDKRFGPDKFVLALVNEKVQALVCCKLSSIVPVSEQELFDDAELPGDNAIFYTIWSYTQGAGRMLILEALDYIKKQYPDVKRFITLSPTTEMARRFHLKNGAKILQVNETTVNYEY